MSDFLIIGGGAVGLLQARELALAGASVTVLDRGQCGQEASWAGGGIVSPLYPWRYTEPVSALARWAQDFYPVLSAALLEETGINPELIRTGLLMLDAGDEPDALAWAGGAGRPMEAVAQPALYAREPQLAQGFRHGLWMPEIANIRNPRLIKALVQSLRQMNNVLIREGCAVTSLVKHGDRISGVKLAGAGSGSVHADQLIVTAGAWSGKILAECGCPLPVRPVKGQMLLYFSPRRLINGIVLHAGRYLIPRSDGHILVGSTLEEVEFDKSTTVEALQSLQASAVAMVPALGAFQPLRQWAGLRPASDLGVPFIGKVPGFSNLNVNAGHFRNGLVLAPASARLLADLLLKRPPIIDPAPYLPGVRLTPGRVSSGGNAGT